MSTKVTVTAENNGITVSKEVTVTADDSQVTPVNPPNGNNAKDDSVENSDGSVNTGDDSSLGLFAGLAILSLAGATGAFALKRKKEND